VPSYVSAKKYFVLAMTGVVSASELFELAVATYTVGVPAPSVRNIKPKASTGGYALPTNGAFVIAVPVSIHALTLNAEPVTSADATGMPVVA